jgi:PPM family protein phosphatase
MKMRPGVEFAGLSDVGCQRDGNEDSYAYWESGDDAIFTKLGRLAVVADGMGGHEGGQIASRIAAETVQQSYSNALDFSPKERLLRAFHEAHEAIQRQGRQNVSLLGMGTTCTAFVVLGTRLYYAHIGDSHLYLLREGRLKLLTRDHSLVARLIETGIIRAEEAESHPQKHVLTAALGVTDEIDPDYSIEPVSLEKGDVIMMCTDGLWGQMSEAEIQQLLGAQSPQEACSSLVKLAKERGGPDNITVVVARIA